MPGRIDYHDDPDAPKPNSMVPSVNVVVANSLGEILLIRRSDNDNWALPGGAIDLGESARQAAGRRWVNEDMPIAVAANAIRRHEHHEQVVIELGGILGGEPADAGSRARSRVGELQFAI